ncbi:PadR family transcriptional regulator [Paenibacillus rhizophilus]|uniref:PadR family transcriptional regulator n=1 Tax=Paenibacillus rhizophilus TaxID=1850366 RepID=A0A3N9NZ03_9BACL|nr:PadR family transcriptional regulator [Paenibacillus rhizophilus]RQW08094.1 PadR family transcriptional regulator [Paenibacillus rhizophilus]
MSSIKYALLSLLAREPLSGYDMKQYMNGRVSFFYKINNNQLYPTLAKLEAEGLVQLESHERESYRPARKVYSITDKGIDFLKAWVMEAEEPRSLDDFMLKQYNSWLVEPEAMIGILREKRKEHEERLKIYRGKIAGFREQQAVYPSRDPLFSSIAVIEMGIRNEESYMEWCDRVIEALSRDEI